MSLLSLENPPITEEYLESNRWTTFRNRKCKKWPKGRRISSKWNKTIYFDIHGFYFDCTASYDEAASEYYNIGPGWLQFNFCSGFSCPSRHKDDRRKQIVMDKYINKWSKPVPIEGIGDLELMLQVPKQLAQAIYKSATTGIRDEIIDIYSEEHIY